MMSWKTETTYLRKSFVSITCYDKFGPEISMLGIINYIHACKKEPIVSINITPTKTDSWGHDE